MPNIATNHAITSKNLTYTRTINRSVETKTTKKIRKEPRWKYKISYRYLLGC